MASHTSGISGLNPLQESLFLIKPDDRLQMTKTWDNHFLQADKRVTKRDEKTRQRIEIYVASSKEQGITWTNIQKLLERPIGVYQPSDLDVQPDTDEIPTTHVVGKKNEERIEWSDQAMIDMHEGTLNYSLQLLRSRGNAVEKLEVLNWIWSSDVKGFETKLHKGVIQKVPVRADQLPFTFQTCCRLSGYRYEELRTGLAWEMRDALKTLGFTPNN